MHRLGLRMCSRQGTLVFALLWFGSWVFLNGLVLVHRRILSDHCSDARTRRILQQLVSQQHLHCWLSKHLSHFLSEEGLQ